MLLEDVKHAVRSFARKPGFTVAAIATLAVGIGANVAVFSVVNTVLLKPVPHPDADTLVVFATVFPAGPNYVTSDGKFNLFREQSSIVQDVAGYRYAPANLTDVVAPEQIQSASVQQRTHEIGIRLALGASSRSVRNMMMFQGIRLAMIGMAIGVALSFGFARLIAGFLFGVQPRDARVLTATTLALLAVTLLACWLPARRAARLSPLEALRMD